MPHCQSLQEKESHDLPFITTIEALLKAAEKADSELFSPIRNSMSTNECACDIATRAQAVFRILGAQCQVERIAEVKRASLA